MNPHSRTFHGLDALRGVAAIAVLLFHSAAAFRAPWLAPSGFLAVDLFFVMSGFVIAYSYEEKIPAMGVRRFMTVRLIRFLPLFYLGGALGILRLWLISLGGAPSGPFASLTYFLFLPSLPNPLTGDRLTPLNGPGWSLLFEIYINLAYAVLLPRLSTKALLLIAAVSGLALVVVLLQGANISGAHWANAGTGTLRVIFSFSVGVAIYRLRDRLPFGDGHSWPILAALAVAAFVPVSPAWNAAFIILMSPLLVIAALRCGRESWIARYGAASSYCIYAIHWPLLSMLDGASRRLSLSFLPLGLALIAGILIAAPILDRRFDRPIRDVLKRLTAMPRAVGTRS